MTDRILLRFGACAVAAGCASVTDHYDPADAGGPPADLSGAWVHERLTKMLVVDQSGAHARGAWTSLGPDASSLEVSGEVKRRVYVAAGPPGSSVRIDGLAYAYPELVITAAPDGRSGRLAVVGILGDPVTALEPATFVRISGGSPPPAPQDPLLKSALLCRLPFDSAGRALVEGPVSADFRDAAVTLSYARDPEGGVRATRYVVPLGEPRQAVEMPFPGEGFYQRCLDRSTLARARAGSPAQAWTMDGKPAWWILSGAWTPGSRDLQPDLAVAELYSENPDGGALPADVLVVARREGARWTSVGGYVAGTDGLLRATAALEGGHPFRVEVSEVQEPPLEDFLAAKETSVSAARWRTSALLRVKNRTLPRMLREGRTSDLETLVDRLEKLMLDLNHEGELAKDQAQRAVETNSGDADRLRQMSLVYKERIEVLKPILAAINDEVANHAK